VKGLGTEANYGTEVARWFGIQYKRRTMFMGSSQNSVGVIEPASSALVLNM
jgi:hypothetical protein